MTAHNRRWHPQVIRAKELAREAGLDPYAPIEVKRPSGTRSRPTYWRFMDAAFDEHFEREAVDNIYWVHQGSFYTDQWDAPRRDNDCQFFYGRCKSGKRWFWHVYGWGRDHHQTGEDYLKKHGWANTEPQAFADGIAAIKRLAAGRQAIAGIRHGWASAELKQINAAERVTRWTDAPINGSDTRAAEYLYGYTGYASDGGSPVRFRITKKTAKRVYYVRKQEYIDQHGEPRNFDNIRSSSDDDAVIGYVNRQKLEADGDVYNDGVHWAHSDHHLYASLRSLLDRFERYRQEPKLDPREMKAALRKLKAAMAAAHPDKGGSNAAFIQARAAYEIAREEQRRERARQGKKNAA